jgi:hypothetical protein
MADRRYKLDEQIKALAVVVAGFRSHVSGGEEHRDQVIEYHHDALAAGLATLKFMQEHEQTIRDAIRAARELDAASTYA